MSEFSASPLYIGGTLRPAAGGRAYPVMSPNTAAQIGQAADADPADLDAAIAAARQCFDHSDWADDLAGRIAALRRMQAILRERAPQNRPRVAAETGAAAMVMAGPGHDIPIEFMSWTLDFAETYGFETELPPTAAMGVPTRRIVRREAAGVVAAITPWNMPVQINLAKVTAALAAGCTVVLKAAPETPWSAALLGEAAAEAGLPPGALNVITAADKTGIGEALARDARVDLISFTGSTATGRRIMELAAPGIKRVFLELGGKSANIILDDAKLPDALYSAAVVCYHAGQGCAIATRLLVPRARQEEALAVLKAVFEAIPYGDPSDPAQMLSPLISAPQRARVLGYIAQGQAEGARLVCGGAADPRNGGYYVQPTIFADVRNDMRIAQEEIFGPVLAVIPFDDDDDAIRIANDSIYGLCGAVHSSDPARALRVARRIRTGTVNINTANVFAADTPFGGYKQSGLGREMGREGFEEYLQLKVIGLEA